MEADRNPGAAGTILGPPHAGEREAHAVRRHQWAHEPLLRRHLALRRRELDAGHGAGPTPRYAPIGGATLGGKVVLQGGIEFNGVQASDEWLFDGTAWVKISATGPTVRSFSLNMTLGGQALIAGGDHAGNPSNHYSDTWSFDGASWAQRATSFGSFWDQIDISSGTECGAAITSGTVGILGVNAAGVAVFDGTSWSHPNIPNPPTHRVQCAAGTL